MIRIKCRYVAKVVFELDALRGPGMRLFDEIKHYMCDGDMKNDIIEVLADAADDCAVTVEQMYANVYEVEENGPV